MAELKDTGKEMTSPQCYFRTRVPDSTPRRKIGHKVHQKNAVLTHLSSVGPPALCSPEIEIPFLKS